MRYIRRCVGSYGLGILIGMLVGSLVVGCTSSRSAEEVASDRANVLGVWKYRTDGVSMLQHGTLQIRVQDGRLTGRFNDQWRGTVEANVLLDGSHMEFNLNQVRISGRIQQDRFEGAIRRSFWDVSESGNERARPGYIVARRVRAQSVVTEMVDVGCPSLLHEASYRCSPLQAQ
jgi:hypothetical protein